jgi:hypothetical protein
MNLTNIYSATPALDRLWRLAADCAIAVSAYAQPKSYVETQMERRAAAADAIFAKRVISFESEAEYFKWKTDKEFHDLKS